MFYEDLIRKIKNLKKEYKKWKATNILVLKEKRNIEDFNFLFNIKKRYFYIKKNSNNDFELDYLIELELLKDSKNLFLIFLFHNKYEINFKNKNSYSVYIQKLKTNINFNSLTNKMYIKPNSNFIILKKKNLKNIDKYLLNLLSNPKFQIKFEQALKIYSIYTDDYSEVYFFDKNLKQINDSNNFYFENLLLENIIFFKHTKRFSIFVSLMHNEYFIKIYNKNKELIAKTKTIFGSKILNICKNEIIFSELFYDIKSNQFYSYNYLEYKISFVPNIKKGFNLIKEKYLFSSDIELEIKNIYDIEKIDYKNLTIIKNITLEINKNETTNMYNLIIFKNKLYLIEKNNELFGEENKIINIWKNINKYNNKLLKEHRKNVLFFNF